MAIVPIQRTHPDRADHLGYPTSDGRPMGETDLHRSQMFDAIETLKLFFAGRQAYVSGNLLLCYRPGNRRKHVSPDVMVVKGIEPRERDNYLTWVEGKGPDVVIEVTSASTRDEDQDEKAEIYRDIIRVKEYFLFDPRAEYLSPPLQGFRWVDGRYVPIDPVDGRLPSLELGLHLEKRGSALRFFDPAAGEVLLTPNERRERAEEAQRQAEEAQRQAEEAQRQAEEAHGRAAAENERMRREIESLRKRLGGPP